MFKPKHTLESVLRELVDGLESGRIVLHEEDPRPSSIEQAFDGTNGTSQAPITNRASHRAPESQSQ
jgi:hypothetical protein